MDRTLSDLAFIGVGILLIAWILWDVFEAVVVPRPTPTRVRLARHLTRGMWQIWRWRAGRSNDPGRRERMLGSFAPLLVVMLVASWMVVLVIGYGLILYGLRSELRPEPDLVSAVYQAGVSLLTIGYGDIVATGLVSRFIELAAAATGLAVVALGITYLFSLYGSFQRREELVTTLDARAGAPPSGLQLLETHARFDVWDDLRRCFADWELWCARVLDTHVAYPILSYFRSSHDGESWVSALGAVLDAATLVVTAIEEGPDGQPLPTGQSILTIKGGAHLVEDVGQAMRIRGTGQVMVEPSEFDEARARLKAAGMTLNPDRDAAWKKFCEVRSGYASTLNGLAAFLLSPPTQWIGDRSMLPHVRRIPQMTAAAPLVAPIDYGAIPANDPVEAGRG